MLPKEVLADALYGSDDNIQKAEKFGVDVVSPVMGGSKDNPLKLFNLSDNGTIQSCPKVTSQLKLKVKMENIVHRSIVKPAANKGAGVKSCPILRGHESCC